MTNSLLNMRLFFLLLVLAQCDSDPGADQVYRVSGVMTVDGRSRTYLINLPPGYYDDDASAFPLVIGLHGTGGKASQFEQDYQFSQKANEANFVVVYPEGVQSNGVLGLRTWNAGTCCDYAKNNQIDDVNFIRELIDALIANYKIDPKKVYATGMSNGGMMAYRLACEIPDKITAIGVVSATMVVTQPCDPSRPVPVLHIHSILDTTVPYNGGIGLKNYYFPPVDSVLTVWSSINACVSPAGVQVDKAGYKFTTWSLCTDGVTIECYLTQDGGHAWPGGSKTASWADTPSAVLNANDLLWDFFRRFELP